MYNPSLFKRVFACMLFAAASMLFLGRSAAAQTPSGPSALKGLQFLEGKWTGVFRGDSDYETYWSGPEGGAYIGMIRFMDGDHTRVFELLSIEQTDRGLVLSVKHFNPGLIAWEEKDEADRYRLIELGDARAVFKQEGKDVRLAMEGGSPNKHLVRRGVLEDGQWVWSDLFVGKRAN